MLKFDNVTVARGQFRLTVDLTIPKGSQIAIMGPSGSGKSTLLGLVAGFVMPVSGAVTWEDADLGARAPGDRPVAMIFQDNNLFPHLTVQQNVALGVRPSGRLNRDEIATVQKAIADVGLAGMEERKPGTLSGGQQSRAALARMLVQDRPVVALDEPFSALGPAQRGEMIDLVRALCTRLGATLLMVTHDPGDARRLGGQLCVVAAGVVSAAAPVDEMLDNPPPQLRTYLG